ncbi:N-acetylmuramoyl-L-alanine amidase [bacterium 1xD42-62]|uniref:N-acetylmuramoyl-L-alanine amidase n=2 Tax=Parablautia muri TaxID=2320879 RepID=A0A9X5BCK3_9FIRM|nr:N-acetylmuramoyl-L-alanine amidase [Parablautia muri]
MAVFCKSQKETDAGADMEQRRRQPVWKAESRRKREKRIARLRRRIIAYTVRGIVAAVLAVMLLLMVCGCLYIRDFFRKDHKDSALKADSVREAVPGVEENKPDTEFPEQEKYTVVLDAGHGGEDGGTVEQTATEKEINLAVVLKMRELLENQGICVVLTREQDIFIKLEERVRVANGEKADLFVSIHCNYYEKDSSIYGLECYYCKGAEDGKYYAERILDTIEKSGEIVSRNAKPSGYYILKNTTVPAVLVETGYLSNYNERNQLISGEYQGKLAQELVEGIVEGLEGKAG